MGVVKGSVVVCMLGRFSRVQFFVTLWAVAHQASLSMEFSRQGYWRGLPCPAPGDLLDPGIKPASLEFSALAGGFLTTRAARVQANYILSCAYLLPGRGSRQADRSLVCLSPSWAGVLPGL